MSELWRRMTHLPRRVAIGSVVGACVVGYGMGLAAGWHPAASGPTRGTAGGGIGVTPAPITAPAPVHATPHQPPNSDVSKFFGPPNSVAPTPASIPARGPHGAGKWKHATGRGNAGGTPQKDGHGGGKHGGGQGHGHGHGK